MAIRPAQKPWTIHVEKSDGEKHSVAIDKVAIYSHAEL